MRHKKPAIPHKKFIQLLMLAGVPIDNDNGRIPSITDILRELHINIHPRAVYDSILQCLKKSGSAYTEMINANTEIYKRNNNKEEHEIMFPLHIRKEAISSMQNDMITEDLMKVFTGYEDPINDITHKLLRVLHCKEDRQAIELLVLLEQPISDIVRIVNTMPKTKSRYNENNIRSYVQYFWNYTPNNKVASGNDFFSMLYYINLDVSNRYYHPHRLHSTSQPDEVIAWLGVVDEPTRRHINNKIFGMASSELIKKMREGKAIPDYTIKIYTSTNRILSEENIRNDGDELRKKVDNLFANIAFLQKEKLSIDDIKRKEAEEPEPEQDEPAECSRKWGQ